VTTPAFFVDSNTGTLILDHCYLHLDATQPLTNSAIRVRGGAFALNGSYVRFTLTSCDKDVIAHLPA
jgi:hypothetical protein